MYKTPAANRLHIGIFGRRNAGKSSLINAVTGQEVAIVSPVPGTTTDPVYKSMEILPIGPCMLIDTAGIDDAGAVGEERVKRTQVILRKTDIGVIVIDPGGEIGGFEEELAKAFAAKKVPFICAVNKCDALPAGPLLAECARRAWTALPVSARTLEGIGELKRAIMAHAPADWSPIPLVADIIDEHDTVVLVCPIDGAMPQGRLILPQVQVMRDILDRNAMAYVTKESSLASTLAALARPPRLVITDSQVFEDVRDIVPADIPLTSFSVVFARHKGDLASFIEGAAAVDRLRDGDEILIAEACTHHVQPEDIGRSKIPTWLARHTGKELHYEVAAGGDFPDDLSRFALIISCGGCMVNRREIRHRIARAKAQAVPITNYGILMARLAGILDRVVAPFSPRPAGPPAGDELACYNTTRPL